jgi:hypothetical protein
MNNGTTQHSPVNAKKVWTAPKLEVILLNSAANSTVHSVSDGFPTKTS